MSDDARRAALRAAVADAYRVFKRHTTMPPLLDVCTGCCVSEKDERALREWPLRELTARHFYEYNGSARSAVHQPVKELAHLLPRMLELLAEGQDIHHSIELSLDRLGSCPPDSWTDAEQQVLDRFALAYFDCVLHGGPLCDPGNWDENALDVLVMFDIGGIDIDPLLALWLRSDDPVTAVEFVRSSHWDFWMARDYSNPFASGRPDFRRRIRDWMLAPAHRERFMQWLLAPEFQAAAGLEPSYGHTPFATMVDAVFDQLTAPASPCREP